MGREDPAGGKIMNQYNPYRAYGILAGVIVGALVAMVLVRAMHKNRSLKTEYDEMQQRIRGTAYTYAFYAIAAYEVIMALAESMGPVPIDPIVTHFAGIALGVTVQAVYSIWNDAYIGLNTKSNQYGITMIVIALFNLVIAIMGWMSGRMVVNGVLQAPFVNMLVFLMFVAIGTAFFLKRSVQREED